MASTNQVNNSTSIRIYGGAADQPSRSGANTADQAVAEVYQVSTTANARRVRAPKRGGRYSFHYNQVVASGATSAFTVWYSNLPDPDPAVDAHWSQDSNIGSIDMTVTGPTFSNVGNVMAEWIRFKPSTVTTAGSGWLWLRVEGTEV